MDSAADKQREFRLGTLRVQPRLNRVVSGREIRTVEGKVMAVLVALAQAPEYLCTKNDLLDAVWPNQAVGDGVLTRAIYELRRALGDDAAEPRYIENVPRRGYRLLMAPVFEEARAAEARRVGVTGVAIVASLVVMTGLGLRWFAHAPAASIGSIAVLPFLNMTGDATKAYVADGLSEEIIHLLAQQKALRVAARTSSFAFRDTRLTAREIGERLGVDSLVEGSVREERGVQRVTIQLIDTATGSHHSSVTIDVVDGDLFEAQNRIADRIVGMLAEAGAPVEPAPSANTGRASPEVYDLYLKARAALHERTQDSLARAKSYLDEALTIDAAFAPAHAALAHYYLVARAYLQLDAERGNVLIRESIDRALTLDPNNVMALVVLAASTADERDYAGAVNLFEKAIELQPSNSHARLWYGELLLLLGYRDAGRASIEFALQLDPLAGSTNTVMALAAAHYDDDPRLGSAARQADALGARLAPRLLSHHEFRAGDLHAFRRELDRYHEVIGIDSAATALIVQAAQGALDETALVAALEPHGTQRNSYFAREFCFLRMHDAALQALLREQAPRGGFVSDVWLPECAPLRSKPAFVTLLRSMGLIDYWAAHGPPDDCAGEAPEPFCASIGPATGQDRPPKSVLAVSS